MENITLNYSDYSDQVKCRTNCCSDLGSFTAYYKTNIHVYLSILICVFGTCTNFLNILVLTRKDLRSVPINRILTALAVADILKMIEYLPFAYHYYIERPGNLNYPYSWAVYMLFHNHFSQVMHTVSVCLTLTLAVWRYIVIGYPERNHILCSDRRCILAIVLCYILSPIICIPTYFAFQIKMLLDIDHGHVDFLYQVHLSNTLMSNETYLLYYFWTYGVIIKLLPCAIMTVISCWLIRKLCRAKKRKQVLRSYIACVNTQNVSKAERRADRTTKMLVAVLLLFALTEFPQGIFGLLSGIKGKCFFMKCYQHFGEIMDILALLSGSINFILYCCMNRMFRMTFGQLFKHKIIGKWHEQSQPSDVQTTTTMLNATNITEI